MSSDDSVAEYSFDTAGHGDVDTRFIYACPADDSYEEHSFRGALEADVDVVLDLESETGWYRPGLEDGDLAAAIRQAHEYAEEQGFDTYNFSFREQYDPDWRSTIKSVWACLYMEDDNDEEAGEELEPTPEAVADGRGTGDEPVQGHAYPGQGRTSPIGVDNGEDDLKRRSSFDASTGWDWD